MRRKNTLKVTFFKEWFSTILPQLNDDILLQILLAQCSIRSEKCDKICAQIEIEEHTECNCDCKVKQHHCNTKQVLQNCQYQVVNRLTKQGPQVVKVYWKKNFSFLRMMLEKTTSLFWLFLSHPGKNYFKAALLAEVVYKWT